MENPLKKALKSTFIWFLVLLPFQIIFALFGGLACSFGYADSCLPAAILTFLLPYLVLLSGVFFSVYLILKTKSFFRNYFFGLFISIVLSIIFFPFLDFFLEVVFLVLGLMLYAIVLFVYLFFFVKK